MQLEELIRANFPGDGIEPVPKGVNGADVIHRVYNRRGNGCGVIVWESKRTKVWSDAWFQKLKDDLRLVKGDVSAAPWNEQNGGRSRLALAMRIPWI